MDEVRRLADLAWPVVIGQLGVMLLGVVDLLMVGRLGETAMAAIALGNAWSLGLAIIGVGTLMGLDPLFAQAHGAGDPRSLTRTLLRSLLLSQLIALPLAGLHFVAGPVFELLGQPAEVIPLAAEYCAAVGWGLSPTLGFLALRGYLQGMGQMRPAAVVVVVANLVNVAANQALIFGFDLGALGALPAMGAVGCGWATTLVRASMFPLLLALCLPMIRAGWPGWEGVFTWRAARHMLKLGLPVGFQSAMEIEAFNAVILMMGWLGAAELAGNAVALNLTSIAFMVPLGIGAAAATRVGNLIGAGQPWSRAAWTAVAMGGSVMGISALTFALVPAPLIALYTEDPPAVAVALALLPLAAAFQLFDGLQAVSLGVLRGAGDTRWPALAHMVGLWLLGLPLGAALTFRAGFGPRGIWIGLTLGLMVVAAILVLRLRWLVARGGYRVLEET